jgi:hypothetical protein
MLSFYKRYEASQTNIEADECDKIIKKYNWDTIAIKWSEIIAKLLK